MSEYRKAINLNDKKNKEAVQKANAAVAKETGGRQLTMGPEDADSRKKWMDAYIAAGGEYKVVKPSGKNVKSHKNLCVLNRYKLIDLTLTVDAPNDKFIMNNPERKFEVLATVTYVKTADPKDLDALPTKVRFSFTDPAPDDARKVDSFEYTAGKFLGKKDDASAVFWNAHAANAATSGDSYKQTAKVTAKNVEVDKKMTAKIYFKPSGVGGDDYKIKAAVLSLDGAAELLKKESNTIVVWRKIKLEPYEMPGQNHVSTQGTSAIITASYYVADIFVEYELGAIHNIANAYKVKYIGLWDHATTSQLNWATHCNKTASETPTPAETAAANGPAGPAQTNARNAIQTKANSWRDRIIAAYTDGLNKWAPDASVPPNSIVAIEYEHPKYSAAAPNADSTTNEWGAFPWLTIQVEGRNIHPDQRWVNGQGLSYAQRAYITAGMSAARTQVVIAHEAGHETKNQFKRAVFGAGDHSAAAGLMDPTASLNAFTVGEKEILKGLK